jgi:hypothetical protein
MSRTPCIFCGDPDDCCPCHDRQECCGEIEAHCCCVRPCNLSGLLIIPMVDEQPCKGRCCNEARSVLEPAEPPASSRRD